MQLCLTPKGLHQVVPKLKAGVLASTPQVSLDRDGLCLPVIDAVVLDVTSSLLRLIDSHALEPPDLPPRKAPFCPRRRS